MCIYKQQNGSLRTCLSLVSTELFLQTVNNIFENVGYRHNKNCTNWPNKAFELSFNDVTSRKIARYLYANSSIYLERKYEKFLEFCRIEEEFSRRKSSKIGEQLSK